MTAPVKDPVCSLVMDLPLGKDCFRLDESQVRLYVAIARHTVLGMAALAICAITAAALKNRTDTQAPPPGRPDQPPPADPGMIALTVRRPPTCSLMRSPGLLPRPRHALAAMAASASSPRPLVPPAHAARPRVRDRPGQLANGGGTRG
jgi:hypothetical protein